MRSTLQRPCHPPSLHLSAQVLQEIKVAETSDADSCSGRHGLAPLGRPNSAAQTAGGGEVAAAAANVPPGLHLLAAAFVALLHGYAFMPCAAAVYYLYVGLKPFKVVGYAISHKTGPGLPWLQFLLCLIAVWRLLLPLSFYTLALLTKHALLRAPRMLASGQPDLSTTRAVLRHWVMGRIMESPLMVSALLLWPGTEASSCLLRALGARIGLRVLVEHPRCHEPDLLVLGEYITLAACKMSVPCSCVSFCLIQLAASARLAVTLPVTHVDCLSALSTGQQCPRLPVQSLHHCDAVAETHVSMPPQPRARL